MKTLYAAGSLFFLLASCTGTPGTQETLIRLQYQQRNIQKQFDTLYGKQQSSFISGSDTVTAYNGLLEQAFAMCQDSSSTDTIIQDVLSSMYFNTKTGLYDCVTSTVFHFPAGSITANGVFFMAPGTDIAPDHDFPITGGSGSYRNIYGTYTRQYRAADSTYHVTLRYRPLPGQGSR